MRETIKININNAIKRLSEAKRYAPNKEEKLLYDTYIKRCQQIKQKRNRAVSLHYLEILRTLIELKELNKEELGNKKTNT